MTLHTKIYESCLNEIRTRLKQEKGTVFTESEIDMLVSHSGSYVKEAAILAMDRQAEFYEWCSNNWWSYKGNSTWYKLHHSGKSTEHTTEELYEIFTTLQ